MRSLKITTATAFLLLSFYMARINIKLYDHPKFVTSTEGTYNQDLYQQLQFLKTCERENVALNMQDLYPEGYVFYYALYGLSWCKFAKGIKPGTSMRAEAFDEIKTAITAINSEQGRMVFQAQLKPEYGAFYQGWLNFLRGNYLQLLDTDEQDDDMAIAFNNGCSKIANAYQSHHTPYLYSYSYGCWPADNMFCMAALALHDELYVPQYADLRLNWLTSIKALVDTNGLVPHEVDLGAGRMRQAARGSSQSLMALALPYIDAEFAAEQFEIYSALFVDHRFGLVGIREYPKGYVGVPDIDSGPVLLGIGGAASVVGMGAMARHGDDNHAMALRGALEGFGWSSDKSSRKRFLFGSLPITDAFIAWSEAHITENAAKLGAYSKRKFQLISGFILLLLLGSVHFLLRSLIGLPEK